MRTLLVLFLGCVSLRADFAYQSRAQVNGGEPIVATRSIKGRKMAVLTKKHSSIIDLDAETITDIDFNKKTYSVTPFAHWKKAMDEAAAKGTHAAGFKVTIHQGTGQGTGASSNKLVGILKASESVIDIAGTGTGALTVAVDTWIGVVPGYEQMRDFTDKLAEKLGYTFAAGLAEPILAMPEAMPGLDEAIRQLNRSTGAPIETQIKVSTPEKTLAEVSVQLDKFAGGAQPAATFVVPDGFKKVDAAP